MAQKWADECVWKHGGTKDPYNTSKFNYVGQNRALSSYPEWSTTGVPAVNNWHSEVDDYDFNSNSCPGGKVCGHYTQVNTKSLFLILFNYDCLIPYLQSSKSWDTLDRIEGPTPNVQC